MTESGPEASLLHGFAADMAIEAEQQQLIRRLQKAQRISSELIADLDSTNRKLAKLRQERNLLMDKVYEKEVATLEFTSGSSDEEESIVLPSTASTRPLSAGLHHQLIFHTVRNPSRSTGAALTASSATPASAHPSTASTLSTMKRDSSEELLADSEIGKKKRIVKTAEAAAATPRKAIVVPTDEDGNVILPVTIGVITLHSPGQVVWDRPAFHNKRYIWPVGYHTSRPYNSCVDIEAQTVYHSQILDGGTGPVFDVYADDNPDQHFQSPTPTGAWTAIVKQVNAVRGRDYTNSASGPDFFGLSNPTISMILEGLPGADKCVHYRRKVFETIPAPSKITLPKGTPKKASSTQSDDIANVVNTPVIEGEGGGGEEDPDITVDFDE